MFETKIYQKRRLELAKTVGEGIIILFGNEDSSMNYRDNIYSFRQDSTFLYYFGIDIPGMHGIIDADSGDEILFGRDPGIEDVIWSGPQPSLNAWAEQCGVPGAKPVSEFGNSVKGYQKSNRTLHLLPPYRTEHHVLLADLFKDQEVKPSEKMIRAVVAQRSLKTEMEIEEIENAHAITYKMQVMAMQLSSAGIPEREIFGKIQGIALSKGAQTAFPVIFSVHGETLHNPYHENIMQDGDLVINDCGAESLEHYAADITRTFPVNGNFSDKQKAIYQTVLEAQKYAIQMMKPGVDFKSVHLAAAFKIVDNLKMLNIMKGDTDSAVRQGAHALFFPHGLGHMMGLDVHDMENLGEDYVGYTNEIKRSDQFGLAHLRFARKLEKDFVMTVEPGVYFIPALIKQWKSESRHQTFINYDEAEKYLDFGGVRIEDDILITQDGNRVLGEAIPREIKEVEDTCQL